jgi:hypothetical protein
MDFSPACRPEVGIFSGRREHGPGPLGRATSWSRRPASIVRRIDPAQRTVAELTAALGLGVGPAHPRGLAAEPGFLGETPAERDGPISQMTARARSRRTGSS